MRDLSILVVDDHKLFREGFSNMLLELSSVNKVTQACNGKEFLQFIASNTKYDIVFMDISMPVLDGVSATKEALKSNSHLKVIALTMHAQHDVYNEMTKAGCVGYILKSASFIEVQRAIVTVLRGDTFLHSKVVNAHQVAVADGSNPIPAFTDREVEIIEFISKGLTSVRIANKLGISKKTVDKHRENIFVKTNVSNAIDLVLVAIRKGIIKL